jgi:hypothetical protein
MLPKTLSTALVAWLFVFTASGAAAQTDQARLMGMVTDGSGGALPGVTVTVSAASMRPTAFVTDGTGRYLTGWLAPGAYNITFALSGFETRSINNVQLGAAQTVVLDQQLSLAALSETVEVTAPAPPPPPPPPPPAPPVNLIPPRPQAKPVDKEILASVCGPRQPMDYSLAIGRVVSHRDDASRLLLGPGDLLRIDAGDKQGVSAGQNLVVRRRFSTGEWTVPKRYQTFGEQAAGLVQIMETDRDSAVAMVVYACGEIVAGDTLEKYVPQPAFFAVGAGAPRFDEPARITLGENGRQTAATGQMMVIDRGIMQGVQRGQRLTIFRRAPGSYDTNIAIGDGVIIAVRADSATMRIDHTTDAITVGDMVALHR